MTSRDFFADILDRYHDRVCLVCPQAGAKTYGDVIAESNRLAKDLSAGKQLVFIEARNTVPSVLAYIGALRGGHAVHLLDPDREEDNEALIETYKPHVLVKCGQNDYKIERLHDEDLNLHSELSVLLATSGSTGSPKLVKLSYDNIQSNTAAIVDYLDMTAHDKTVISLKFHYSYGLSIVNTHLAVGGTLVLTEQSVQNQIYWDLFKDHQATNFSGVPDTFKMIAQQGIDFSSFPALRIVTQAGGKLASEFVRRFAAEGKKQNWKFYVMYGQTEAAPRMSYLPPDLAEKHPDCIGVAIPGGRLYLVDDAHNRIEGTAHEGELVYEGSNVMVGYAHSHKDLATKESIERLFTGDLAVKNEDGLFRITGRRHRFVKPFGLRISLDDIENYLGQQNLRGFVVGQDRRILICTENQTVDQELLYQLADKYQLPASLFKAQKIDTVPLLSNGKIDYRRLESLYLKDLLDTQTGTTRFMAFMKQFWSELWALLTGAGHNWTSVVEIFTFLFPGKTITPESSFISLGGDSLLNVEMSICLQDYLGYLPPKWQCQSVFELQSLSGGFHE